MKKTFTFEVNIDEDRIVREVVEERKRNGIATPVVNLITKKVNADKYDKKALDMMSQIYDTEQRIYKRCLDAIFPSTIKVKTESEDK